MKEDPYLQRPPFDNEIAGQLYPKQAKQEMIEENLMLAASGYSFGWISGSIVDRSVIVEESTRTIPVVKIGFIINVSISL